ncbi:hypothetical protein L228DRAFT_156902 [Xylona heveae TC161]|uniref:Uncharacterized protein n=1 Tax=Xylona heveae (strain CBS 132557 / TC161) TaxID=1328760 RepID=A0A165G218_XYLHT|nr:hypothetical protein L228DRAFT_156902 [Xylona heveae TC161]KZF21648.1 hypothetical protein L228DRAFT_156902 [Xylona heveae TC161]
MKQFLLGYDIRNDHLKSFFLLILTYLYCLFLIYRSTLLCTFAFVSLYTPRVGLTLSSLPITISTTRKLINLQIFTLRFDCCLSLLPASYPAVPWRPDGALTFRL